MKTIKVHSIIKAPALNQNHVALLLKHIKSSIVGAEPIELDFGGVIEVDVFALQQILLPLVSELSGSLVKRLIRFANHNEAVVSSIREALQYVDKFVQDEEHHLYPDTGIDQEIYDLNVALLIKCREVARVSPLLARVQFGLVSDSVVTVMAGLTTAQIQGIAKTGINVFKPNFDERMLDAITKLDLGDADILIGMASLTVRGRP
jgi:hypothetical protein